MGGIPARAKQPSAKWLNRIVQTRARRPRRFSEQFSWVSFLCLRFSWLADKMGGIPARAKQPSAKWPNRIAQTRARRPRRFSEQFSWGFLSMPVFYVAGGQNGGHPGKGQAAFIEVAEPDSTNASTTAAAILRAVFMGFPFYASGLVGWRTKWGASRQGPSSLQRSGRTG